MATTDSTAWPETANAAEVGGVINGRYRVEELLGFSGAGSVCRVTDLLSPERRIALKTACGAPFTPSMQAMFKTEFLNMAKLSHPNIVEVYDFEPLRGTGGCLFTMEFVEGLDIYKATEGADWKTVLDLIVQVCRALAYVHSRKIIYHDLKPNNIIISRSSHAKLLDFGLSGARAMKERETSIRGTVAYMAPELWDPQVQRDHRIDLYSLGIMLYQLLCRRLPFTAETLDEWIHKHHFQAIEFSKTETAGIPEWLRDIVLRLSAKAPDERFRSTYEVIETLNREGGFTYELETAETRECYVLGSRLVGLDSEWEWGKERPLFVMIEGQSGMGKSRFLREIRHQAQVSGIQFIDTHCVENDPAEFAPLRRILEVIAAVLIGVGEQILVDHFTPDLAAIVPKPYSGQKLKKVDSLENVRRQRLGVIERVSEFILRAADRVPLILCLDDLQWADAGTVEWLTFLSRRVSLEKTPEQKTKLELIGSYRSDEIEGRPITALIKVLTDLNEIETITLSPLKLSQVRELLLSMLGTNMLPDAMVELLTRETGGNPYFIKEMTRSLLENGSLSLVEGAWSAKGEALKLKIPKTISAAFLRSASFLGPSERAVLDLLAVYNRPAPLSLLSRIVAKPSEAMHSLLMSLCKKDILIQSPGKEILYSIAHGQMRNALYEQIGAERKKELHARIAEVLEAETKSVIFNNRDDLLSQHHYEAGHWDEAIHYGCRAVKKTKDLNSYFESVRLFERTLSWLKSADGDRRYRKILIHLLVDVVDVYENLGMRDRQSEVIEELLRILDPERDKTVLIEALVRKGDLQTSLGQFREGRETLNRALRLVKRVPHLKLNRKVLKSLAFLNWQAGNLEEAARQNESILQIDLQMGDQETYVSDSTNYGAVLRSLGHYDRALEHLQKTLKVCEEIKDPVKKGPVLFQIATIHRDRHEWDKALDALIRVNEVVENRHKPLYEIIADNAIAATSLEMGDPDSSIQWHLKGIKIARDRNLSIELSNGLIALSEVLISVGRDEEAIPHLLEAVRACTLIEDDKKRANAWALLAGIYEKRAETFDEALKAWQTARFLCQQNHEDLPELLALEGLIRMTRLEGHLTQALPYLQEALERVRRMGDRAKEVFLLNSAGIVNWGLGDFTKALEYYRSAFEISRELGDEVHCGLMLNSIGITLRSLGRYDEALSHLTEAREFNRNAGQKLHEGYSLAALGDLALDMGNQKAVEYYQASLEIRKEIQDRRGEGWMLYNLAKAYTTRGTPKRGQECAVEALALAEECGDQELRESCLRLQSQWKGVEFKRHLDALLQVSLATVYEPEKQEQVALDQIVQILGADRAFLFLWDEGKKDLRMKIGRDKHRNDLEQLSGYSKTVVKKVLETQKPLIVRATEEGEELGAKSIVIHNLKSIMATPLMIQSRFVGVVYLDNHIKHGAFSEADLEILSALTNHIAVAIDSYRVRRLELESRELQKDLEVTGAVQNLLLPKESRFDVGGLKGVVYYQPAAQAGGDWWWYDTDPQGRVLFLMGDVTGHGPGAAMLTAVVAGAYQAFRKFCPSGDVADLLLNINDVLVTLSEDRYFMSLLAIYFDPQSKELEFWNAAAPPFFVIQKEGNIDLVRAPGPLLGTKDLPKLGTDRRILKNGDRVFVFTDGVSELSLSDGRRLGLKKLRGLLEEFKDLDLDQIRQKILQRFETLRGETPLSDDVTFACMEFGWKLEIV